MLIVVLLSFALLFVGWKKPYMRPVRLVLSAGVCIWGVVNMAGYRALAMEELSRWLGAIAPNAGYLPGIQQKALHTLNFLIPLCCWGPILIAGALLLVALVLRRIDMDITRPIYMISGAMCILPALALVVLSVPTLWVMPQFFFVIWPLIVNVAALLTLPLTIFCTVIRVPAEGLGSKDRCAF